MAEKDSFAGMTSTESIEHQLKNWLEGRPLHNPIRNECCPDFSCCNGGKIMLLKARQRFAKAFIAGDLSTMTSICCMALNGLLVDNGIESHIVGEDTTKH